MSSQVPRPFPQDQASTTHTVFKELLAAILATSQLHEISSAEDFGAVERYIRSMSRVDENGHITSGLMFRVYPTGGKGPYETMEDGSILKHGLLLTIEPGALVSVAVRRAQAALPMDDIAHEHIAAS